jgi:hypothetical protein
MPPVVIIAQQFKPRAYWGRPNRASAGDPDHDGIFRAIGNALTNWESAEYALARIFMLFVESKSEAPGRAYGAITSATTRRAVLAHASDAFITKFGNEAAEHKANEDMLKCYSNASARRNEIVHAVTSGLNFTQNHRFEFAVAAAAGAVD